MGNNCAGIIAIEFGSTGWSARRRRRFWSRSLGGGRLLSSAEGLVCSVVVPLEVGGAGSLLPRAPVSVEEDDCAFLLTGFPVIFI